MWRYHNLAQSIPTFTYVCHVGRLRGHNGFMSYGRWLFTPTLPLIFLLWTVAGTLLDGRWHHKTYDLCQSNDQKFNDWTDCLTPIMLFFGNLYPTMPTPFVITLMYFDGCRNTMWRKPSPVCSHFVMNSNTIARKLFYPIIIPIKVVNHVPSQFCGISKLVWNYCTSVFLRCIWVGDLLKVHLGQVILIELFVLLANHITHMLSEETVGTSRHSFGLGNCTSRRWSLTGTQPWCCKSCNFIGCDA